MSSEPFPCRSCSHTGTSLILSLGKMPLANSFLRQEQLSEEEPRYQLDLVFCEQCGLVQITEDIPPGELFSEYLYLSSYSETMLTHARGLVAELTASRFLSSDSLVIEIGSNDGYLLQYYLERGIPVLGIEPAANVAKIAQDERKVPTLCKFLGPELAQGLRANGRVADVVHVHNVLAHVADLNGFVQALLSLLKADGVAVIEVPYVRDLVDGCEFDTIYHEHLCYFSLTALVPLFHRHGLRVESVVRTAIHGGSLRLTVCPGTSGESDGTVNTMLEDEQAAGMSTLDYYEGFARSVQSLREELYDTVRRVRTSGKRLAAYGAAAKGTVLLNYLRTDTDTIEFIVDRNPLKQGLYVPGVRIPVLAPSALRDRKPDYLLILPWNIAEEIMVQEHDYHEQGGRFIIPIPKVQIV